MVAMNRRTVLCFGDSNTWGRDPHSAARLPEASRWPDVLAAELGGSFRVIAEGLNGRTTVWEDPVEEHRCGKAYLSPCLLTHHPLDLVILMLGTNDLKKRFSVSAFDIGRSIGLLLDMIRSSGCGPDGGSPEILLMCPPPVERLSEFAEMFEGAREKSLKLPHYYRLHAEQRGCRFFDTAEIIRSSDADGIHFEPEDQVRLGREVAGIVRGMLPGGDAS